MKFKQLNIATQLESIKLCLKYSKKFIIKIKFTSVIFWKIKLLTTPFGVNGSERVINKQQCLLKSVHIFIPILQRLESVEIE